MSAPTKEAPTAGVVRDHTHRRFAMIYHDTLEALAAAKAGPIDVAVYLWLKKYAGDDGSCFPSYTRLSEKLGIGRATLRRSLEALEAAGFVQIERVVDPDNSALKPNIYHLRDGRQDAPPSSVADYPPSSVADYPRPLQNCKKIQVHRPKKEKDPLPPTPTPTPPERPEPERPRRIAYAADFEAFWRAYSRPGDTKKQAAAEYAKLTGAERAAALAALPAWKASEQWRRDGGKYQPYALRWLRDRRWEDEPPPPPAPAAASDRRHVYLGVAAPPEIADLPHNDGRRQAWMQKVRDERNGGRP